MRPRLQLGQTAQCNFLLDNFKWLMARAGINYQTPRPRGGSLQTMEKVLAKSPRSLLAGVWTVMISGIILTQENGNAFIHSQF